MQWAIVRDNEQVISLEVDFRKIGLAMFKYSLIGLEWLLKTYTAATVILILITAKVSSILAPITNINITTTPDGTEISNFTFAWGETVIQEVKDSLHMMHEWALLAALLIVGGLLLHAWERLIGPWLEKREEDNEET